MSFEPPEGPPCGRRSLSTVETTTRDSNLPRLPVALEDSVELDIMPGAVPPVDLAGGAFVLVAGLLVDPFHGGVERAAAHPVEAELGEREAGPHEDGVAGVPPAPGRTLAENQSAGRRTIPPVDLVQADESHMLFALVKDRPGEVI